MGDVMGRGAIHDGPIVMEAPERRALRLGRSKAQSPAMTREDQESTEDLSAARFLIYVFNDRELRVGMRAGTHSGDGLQA